MKQGSINKYVLILGAIVVLVILGVLYKLFLLPASRVPVISGKTIPITIIAKKNEWRFVPETIEVNRGDKLILTMVNEDNYDHGIGIVAFGVSKRMPANQTITAEFIATQAGEYPFICSVPCGEGKVKGKKRGHFDMVGTIKVKDIILTPSPSAMPGSKNK